VIDVFAVSAPASGHARQALESELYAALPTPPPKPATEAG
jgi:hypothetical protein